MTLRYAIPLVPGPTRVPESVRRAYLTDYPSADLEPEYAELYTEVQAQLQQILETQGQLAIMTGEGMIGLWGALKSCLLPGDRVLAVSTGVFGQGIGEMARSVGAEVRWVEFGYDEALRPEPVEQAIRAFSPKLVTAVHCETPSGTLNPVELVGELVRRHDVPLFYVDAVASAAGAPVRMDARGIDLCLIGNQKALSAPPDLAAVAVSERAWEIVERVGYQGYDALAPFHRALERGWFPYTPAWHSLAALREACRLVLDEGLERVYARHEQAAGCCRRRAAEMGLTRYCAEEEASAPTVTALRVPDGVAWDELHERLRARGLGLAGSLGPLQGKVFRVGHMGSQADVELVDRGMDVVEAALKEMG
jgi:aspartate aminotransferase-like enzyme